MMTNKDRFLNEEQFEIALESIERAYEEKYGVSGYKDTSFTGGNDTFENFIDMILANSDESNFEGTDEEIAKMWYDTEMFE